jgi:long-subunit fatty acid transport protein
MPRRISFLFLMFLIAGGGFAVAQEEAPPVLEFSFSNPGARSMGFGGAFVALADDATAAFANPAGLIQLVDPEVSIEGRAWSYASPFVSGGRIFGPPTGLGLDTIDGLNIGISSVDVSGMSFLSFVYPAGNWSVAFYRHQLANYEFSSQMNSLFAGPWPGFPDSRERSWDLRKVTELKLESYGVSAAYRVSDALSVGLGVGHYRGSLLALSEVYGFVEPRAPFDFWSFQTLFAPEYLVESSLVTGRDTDFAFLGGVLWQVSERWNVGAVYRQGPELQGASEVRAGPMNRYSVPAGTVLALEPGKVKFPGVLGIGASFRSKGERLTFGFEWDRVGYSSILKDSPEFYIEDANELRAGAEYVLVKRTPVVAARLGLWLDPDHTIRYQGDDYIALAVLHPGSDELHVAAGLGVVYKRVQLDVGIDLSDQVDTVSVSIIYTF